MNAVDTNVLIYAVDPRDPAKREAALSLLESLEDGVLLWQVAVEYLAACRKLEPHGYSIASGWQDIDDLASNWTTILPDWRMIDRAKTLLQRFSLSFWDAMIVAACLEGGVKRLYSEDFGASPEIEGVQIINPFTE